ncbi:hypothetical protein AaE_005731 [Aphanomyces astaci]|uniref:Uncharacterized protein n=1 Tax=Aphanomyces astaci TaxID=112090 RepID=A0A6A5AHQ7_APHAT|nr:hypothetical protein AaE_005731 [Aphanomyces astaci]
MEIARYDRLSEEMETTRQQCAMLIEAQDKQQKVVLENERRAANSRAKEQVELIKRVKEDLTYNHVKFEEILSQQEEDYEFQIQKLKQEYEGQLTVERQNTAIKETQITGKNSKIDSLKKKIQELKANASARDILLSTEKAKTVKLETALANYERHFDGLQGSIDEKEKAVQGLKASNRVLESFRFVLDHRVEELQSEKSPMQKLISGLESHIHDVQEEMVDQFHQKDLEIKIKALTNEVNALRLITRKKESEIGAMSREFARIVLISNPKELERAVKEAYIVYVKGEAPKDKRTRSILSSSSKGDDDPHHQSHAALAGLGGDDNREPGGSFLSPLKKSASAALTAQRLVVGSVLPFRAIEQAKDASRVINAATAMEYRQQIDAQRKEIQRLKTQVGLLLNENATNGDPATTTSTNLPDVLSTTNSKAKGVHLSATQTAHSITRRQSFVFSSDPSFANLDQHHCDNSSSPNKSDSAAAT